MGNSNRKKQSENRRCQIVDSALGLFSKKGFSAATISDLADQAGISEGLIYHYFDSKLELLTAVVHHHGFIPRLRAMLTPIPDDDARTILLRVAREWWEVMQEKRTFIFMVFAESQHNPAIADMLGHLVREGTFMVTRYLKTRARKGELRCDVNLEVAARMFLSGLFMFFFHMEKLSPPLRKISPDTYFTNSVDTLIKGLQK